MRRPAALLALADGEVFGGEAAGALDSRGLSTGELVFNTALSGYQEVVTDPSYAGQVIAFTYPHIGNYGTSALDDESRRPFCCGVVVRDLVAVPSNWRSTEGFEDFLVRHGVPAITGVDTRRLTRHLREQGSMGCAMGTGDEASIVAAAASAATTTGRDLVSGVTTERTFTRGTGSRRIVAVDFGVKETMLNHLARFSTVTVVPASTSAAEVLALGPHGVLLSNGPGDPDPLLGPIGMVSDLIGRVPLFGICLGHQLLALALGGRTFKLPFGHHGINHPVQHIASGRVEVTSQNHNYAVAEGSVPEAEVTHRNLNDGVIEGLRSQRANAFSVQFHPEAGPGPHDAQTLFTDFLALIEAGAAAGIG
jgi:carbamoyl-phosphate synthase small subunit